MNEFSSYEGLLTLTFTILITVRFYHMLTNAVGLSYHLVFSPTSNRTRR